MRKALAFDFDGTMAATFEDSPVRGMNVHRAYKLAIQNVLGDSAHSAYLATGGLKNRAPREVVSSLVESVAPIAELTEQLVQAKIDILTNCVGECFADGSTWPRPMPGFVDYWRRLSADERYLTVIISSGHTAFINAWLDGLGLARADSMITDDDLRGCQNSIAKPDKRIFEKAMYLLRERHPEITPIGYFGDDPAKDGQLAENAGVPFFQFDQTGKDGFADWSRAPVP